MTVGPGFCIVVRPSSSPCAASPSFSSVGTPFVNDVGTCPFDNLVIRTNVSLSGTIPSGGAIQFRTYFGTSSGGTPSGTWTNVPGWSGSSGVHDFQPVGDYVAYDTGTPLSGTYYYKAEFRLLGTDSSTVCASQTSNTLNLGTLYSCQFV